MSLNQNVIYSDKGSILKDKGSMHFLNSVHGEFDLEQMLVNIFF